MISRFAVALFALAAIVTPAWAEGGVDPTALSTWAGFLKDGGPWAFLVIAGYVIWTQRNEIRDLNAALVLATGKAAEVSGSVLNAMSSLESEFKRTDERAGERWTAVKEMNEDLGRVATLVGSNGQSIAEQGRRVDDALRDLKVSVEAVRSALTNIRGAR